MVLVGALSSYSTDHQRPNPAVLLLQPLMLRSLWCHCLQLQWLHPAATGVAAARMHFAVLFHWLHLQFALDMLCSSLVWHHLLWLLRLWRCAAVAHNALQLSYLTSCCCCCWACCSDM
jgi:hypothetical protein